VFGLDTSSAANGSSPTQDKWDNAFNDADGDGQAYKFAFVRSSRGGTVDATFLDDSQYYDNVTRGTNAGLLMGSYHFARPDVTTHTAIDDAQHYLNHAGMYMKPGYLLPVFDLEDGNTENTTAQLTTWGVDFINTIFNAKGIYPIVYTNSSYNNDEVFEDLAFGNVSNPNLRTYQWLARPSGNLASGDPIAATNYPNPYGVWDPNFITRTNSRDPAVKPWAFWQNGSGSPNGFLIDKNAANGNIEFVKDFLVPALWTNAGSGDWGTISNWNSDNPGFVMGDTSTGPAPRLPNNASLDWVKLQNSGGGTVTISSGAQSVRKFYTQQPLNITGGSLTVGYVPGSGGQFDLPSEFKAAVTLSSGAAYSAHTTVVDGGGGMFNINGGTVTFTQIQLASHASNSGKLNLGGNATFAQTGAAGTSVIRSTGSLAQAGSIVLLTGGGTPTFTVNNGSAAVDLNVRVGVSGSGRLVKSGPGTMQLSNSTTYSGGTTINGGVLQVAADDRLGSQPALGTIILDSGTLRTGAQINSASLTNAGSGYSSFPTLAINGGGANVLPAAANVLAGINSIVVPPGSGGSGYVNQSSAPAPNTAGTFVDIVGGGGSGATAFATVVGGVVTGITITNQGSGYTSMPTIHISSTAISGIAGTGAAANVNGITLQSIALTDGGFDYNSPTISLTGGGGSGATASAASTGPNWAIFSGRPLQMGAAGGTLEQTAGTTLTYAGVISGSGALTKRGAGTLRLTGSSANTYSGLTTVGTGTLRLGKTVGINAVPTNLSIGDGSGTALAILDASEQINNGGNVNVFQQTLDLNGFNETIGSLTMSIGRVVGNGGTLTLSGSGVSTFASTAQIDCNLNLGGASRTFSIGDFLPADDCVISGTISNGGLAKSNGGTLRLTGNNSYTGATTVSGGKLVLDQSLTSSSSVSITNTNVSIILSAAGGNHVIKTGAVSIAGRLDLTDNKLITTSAVGSVTAPGTTYSGVSGLIQSGRNGGNWSGNGIVTSQSAATTGSLTSIGIATAAEAKAIDATATAVWAGQTVTGSDTLVMYTYGGDANLDGKLNVDDYGRIDSNIGLTTAGWYNGDFNYDGKVNVDDYAMLDSNIGIQGAPFPSAGGAQVNTFSAVPEPSAMMLGCAALAAGAVRRRRRAAPPRRA
jgi:autotransporter-associated beta strand protein